VIRSTLEVVGNPPPPNQPSVKLPAAVKLCLAKLSGPRTLAVAVSVANVIRSTVEKGPGCPPPNHAAVFSGGGGGSDAVIVNPPKKESPLANVIGIV
jgi:hypothetical protein